MVLFTILGQSEPLYEAEIGEAAPGLSAQGELAYLRQFVLHSSLDMIQNAMWNNNATFLRTVDRFNSLLVSAYVTPGGTVLLLLHQGKPEDAVRQFFTEMHELYTKYLLNPFATFDTPIVSPQFDAMVRSSAARLLQ